MKIGGYQSLTLSDFPGNVAAIVFTQGCNFRCPFCHNFDLLGIKPSKKTFNDQDIFDNLKSRLLLLDGVVITGGEPTLQKDLFSFISKIKNIGLKIKLDTNGSNPKIIENLLNNEKLDYIAMDIKAPFSKYNQVAGVDVCINKIKRSIDLILASKISYEFRTTFAKDILSEKDICEIKKSLPNEANYKIQVCKKINNL